MIVYIDGMASLIYVSNDGNEIDVYEYFGGQKSISPKAGIRA